jgi:hypothetical protein
MSQFPFLTVSHVTPFSLTALPLMIYSVFERGLVDVDTACSEKLCKISENPNRVGLAAKKVNTAWRKLGIYLKSRVYLRTTLASGSMITAAFKGLVCTTLVFYDPLVQHDGHSANSVPRF